VTDGDFDNAAWLDDDTLIVAPLRARVGVRSLLWCRAAGLGSVRVPMSRARSPRGGQASAYVLPRAKQPGDARIEGRLVIPGTWIMQFRSPPWAVDRS
jgi:hypothetical protein